MTEDTGAASPSELIDARIEELSDWRGETLARLRKLIKQAAPDVVEEWKWRGVPTWYVDGMLCTGETYRDKVKVTFAKGASLDDPTGLFNSSLGVTPGAPSTSARETRSTNRRSWPSFAQPSHSTARERVPTWGGTSIRRGRGGGGRCPAAAGSRRSSAQAQCPARGS